MDTSKNESYEIQDDNDNFTEGLVLTNELASQNYFSSFNRNLLPLQPDTEVKSREIAATLQEKYKECPSDSHNSEVLELGEDDELINGDTDQDALARVCDSRHRYDTTPANYNPPQIMDKSDVLWLCLLSNQGGRVLPLIRYKLQFWRFITSLFLHVNLGHLIGNVLFLYFLLAIVQQHSSIPAPEALVLMFTVGVSANIYSSWLNQDWLGVGFSPVVYSFVGLILHETI